MYAECLLTLTLTVYLAVLTLAHVIACPGTGGSRSIDALQQLLARSVVFVITPINTSFRHPSHHRFSWLPAAFVNPCFILCRPVALRLLLSCASNPMISFRLFYRQFDSSAHMLPAGVFARRAYLPRPPSSTMSSPRLSRRSSSSVLWRARATLSRR